MSEAVLIVQSKLRPGASRERFFELSRETKSWLETQSGFVSYVLFDGGKGRWTDAMTWSDMESMDAGNAAFSATQIAKAFQDLVEPDFKSFVGRAVDL